MRTPWGQPNHSTAYGPLTFYSTPSHGGFKVPAAMNARISPAWRREGGWYEEDCDWSIVVITFPEYFTPETIASAYATARNWFPHEYQIITGKTLTAADSTVLREEEFERINKEAGNLFVHAAWGDWADWVPAGMVGVAASKEPRGARLVPCRRFLVPAADYVQPFAFPEGKYQEVAS